MLKNEALISVAIPDFLHAMGYWLRKGEYLRVLWYWKWIGAHLWRYSRYSEYIRCDELAIRATEQFARVHLEQAWRLKAIILSELGFAHLELGHFEPADRYIEESAEYFRRVGDDLRDRVRIRRYRALLQYKRGDTAEAERLCEEALDLLADAARRDLIDESKTLDVVLAPPGDDQGYPRINGNWRILSAPFHSLLGSIDSKRREFAAARMHFLCALAINRNLDGIPRAYWALSPLLNLGQLYEDESNVAMAKRYYRLCLKLTDGGILPDMRAAALFKMAGLSAVAGDSDEATLLATQALQIYEVVGKYADRQRVRQLLGRLATARS